MWIKFQVNGTEEWLNSDFISNVSFAPTEDKNFVKLVIGFSSTYNLTARRGEFVREVVVSIVDAEKIKRLLDVTYR